MDLDGRTFAAISNTADGEVGSATRFTYREDGGTVWAEYAGGDVARGISSEPAPPTSSTSATST